MISFAICTHNEGDYIQTLLNQLILTLSMITSLMSILITTFLLVHHLFLDINKYNNIKIKTHQNLMGFFLSLIHI